MQQSMSKLTAKQIEVLRLANKRGWFEVPRDATLEDIADELDISTQAASDRMRRAMRNMTDTSAADGEMDEILRCVACGISVWTMRTADVAHLTCRCAAEGDIEPVKANEMAVLPERWIFTPVEGEDD